jgi:acetylornithine deacetylase/succinyl-diaminopimelate desuccinylase-like protein
MSDTKTAHQYAANHQAEFLEEFKALLAMPSVSTLPEHAGDVRQTAEWLADQLRSLKLDRVEVMDTPGHPIVYGEYLGAPGKPTVLVYGHYDVQPVDPLNEWDADPFAGTIDGDYIVARGASDMKGQIFAQLKAMEAITQDGPPPVNIKYLIEGEEEIGSPNLEPFVRAHQEMLACDFVLNCDAGIYGPELPAIMYSLRGLAYFEVSLRTAKKDLHSGRFGGSVRNPIHELANLIAGLHDAAGHVTLPGFYDKVRDLDDEERAALAEIPYTHERWMEMAGTKGLYGEEGYTTVERVGARPALDVNGIWGGFTGAGAKTVLPAVAHCKLSARLVADQDPKDVLGQLQAYFDANTPEDVTVEVHQHSVGAGAIMDRKSDYMRKATAALEEIFGTPPIFIREGGSIPIVAMMQQILQVDSILLGFALPDDGIHGPNERQYLPNFYRGIDTYISFIESL